MERFVTSSGRDERQGYCLAFLTTYYEYKIAQMSKGLYGLDYQPDDWDSPLPLNSALASIWRGLVNYHSEKEQEVDEIIDNMTVMTILGPAKYADPVAVATLKAEMCEDVAVREDAVAMEYANSVKEQYESDMRPLLEEYYLRMNAMLGYVQDDTIRNTYEARIVIVLNRERFLNAIDIMLYSGGGGDASRKLANEYRKIAGLEQQKIAERREAQLLARKSETGELQDFPFYKEPQLDDISITIPPFSPIYMRFTMSGNELSTTYGAFGNEVIKARDLYTGYFSETLITRNSVLPTGLGELSTLANEIRDVINAKDAAEYVNGKLNPIGNIPSFDRTKGEGKTYTYDYAGRLVDVTVIREESTSATWGPLGVSQTTTHRKGYMSSSWSSDTKTDLSFGPFTVSH